MTAAVGAVDLGIRSCRKLERHRTSPAIRVEGPSGADRSGDSNFQWWSNPSGAAPPRDMRLPTRPLFDARFAIVRAIARGSKVDAVRVITSVSESALLRSAVRKGPRVLVGREV